MRSIMDSIGGRLDEARDTGRYLVGLLVFLGLLCAGLGMMLAGLVRLAGRIVWALVQRGVMSPSGGVRH